MRLDSFNAGYVLVEDRILLQAIGDGSPQNYWITRRAALMLGEGIQNVLTEQCTKFGAQIISAEHVGEMLSFGQETAMTQNPPKPGALVQENTDQAILLFQISYVAEDATYCVLQLTDQAHQGHQYRLTREMLHALLNLIQSQCDQADWGIRINQPATPALVPPSPRALH